jgi:hypothetical protein
MQNAIHFLKFPMVQIGVLITRSRCRGIRQQLLRENFPRSVLCKAFLLKKITGTIISIIEIKENRMIKSLLYVAAVVLAITWVVGFFLMGAGALIHTLPVFALLSSLQAIIIIPKPKPEPKF